MSEWFLAITLALGFFAGQDVADTKLVRIPTFDTTDEALHVLDPGVLAGLEVRPSLGWAVAAGVAVAAIYALSIVAHELGHLVAARRAGAGVAAMQLHFAGGYVEVDDDDSLTAGKLAAIAVAGPLVTAVLALVSWLVLTALGWPLAGVPVEGSAAAAAAGRVLSAAFVMNLLALVINLVPLRSLDGGLLLEAARLWRGRGGG